MITSKQSLIGKIQAKQSLTGNLNNAVIYRYPELEDLDVIPGKEEQDFKSNKYGYKNVKVSGDENLVPDNIKENVSIFGVGGTAKVSNNNAMMNTEINNAFFSSCSILNSLVTKIPPIVEFTINTTNLSNMFYNCAGLTEIDLSNFNTSKVSNMSYMFYNCNALTNLDLSSFDTSKVTNMYGMFCFCIGLTSIDLSNFNTSKVTNISTMFQNCTGLTEIDLSNFDTSNVTSMSYMFGSCIKLTKIDLSNFNTSKVSNMSYMFYNCNVLTNLDLSSFDTSKVQNMRSMFEGCNHLQKLDISNFDFTKVTNHTYMFRSIPEDCLIYVKDETAKEWITSKFTSLTNVQIKETN